MESVLIPVLKAAILDELQPFNQISPTYVACRFSTLIPCREKPSSITPRLFAVKLLESLKPLTIFLP